VTGKGPPFAIGAKVRLRHCAFGEPGTVLRVERRMVVVLWHDLDYLARHSPESLMLATQIQTSAVTAGGKLVEALHSLGARSQSC
jgi:hypothetical protein